MIELYIDFETENIVIYKPDNSREKLQELAAQFVLQPPLKAPELDIPKQKEWWRKGNPKYRK